MGWDDRARTTPVPSKPTESEQGKLMDDRHRFYIDIDNGWVGLTVTCPYVRPDQTRPCWPHDETGPNGEMEPMEPPQATCVYQDFVDNLAIDEILQGRLMIEIDARAVWGMDGMSVKIVSQAVSAIMP